MPGIEWAGWAAACLDAVPHANRPLVSYPPVLFCLLEVAVMLPRAVRGHQWYHAHFPSYPRARRAAVPFLL